MDIDTISNTHQQCRHPSVKNSRILILAILFALPTITCLCLPSAPYALAEASHQAPIDLTFYTSATATTPQIPLWAALSDPQLGGRVRLSVEPWKNLDGLKQVMLAGKGDMWLGHLEAFALARAKGAHIRLIAVSAWRKFFLLSTDPSVGSFRDCALRNVGVTPIASPALPLLERIFGMTWAKSVSVYEPSILAMHAMRGTYDTIVAPEPLVSQILAKRHDFRVVESLEDAYGQSLGRKNRIPWAGIAVSQDLVDKHPALMDEIVLSMKRAATRLANDPAQALSYMPKGLEGALPDEIILESLTRDTLGVERAQDIREEIEAFLGVVMPEQQRSSESLREILDGLIGVREPAVRNP